jgi:ribosomal protein L11 methyltransferase
VKRVSKPVWRIEVITTAAAQPAFAQAIEDRCDALAAFELTPGGPWRLEGFTMDEPETAWIEGQLARAASGLGLTPPAATIERLPEIDWVTRTRRSFVPIRAGRFFVYGSHHEGGVPAGAVGIKLDASLAFGSGEHATTRGCLLALDRLARRGRRRHMLDLGCGSGILSIAGAKTWQRSVLAADIDHDSVRLARENAHANGVPKRRLRIRWSDGMNRLGRGRRFDAVCANILARPLRRLSCLLSRAVAPGGTLVLSGLLISQGQDIVAAYRAQGMALTRRITLDGWETLIFRRNRRDR